MNRLFDKFKSLPQNKVLASLWVGAVCLTLFIYFQLISGSLSSLRGGDTPLYILLAKALAEGHGYRDMNVPGHPLHSLYPPPGFPLILASIYKFFGYNFLMMRLAVIFFTLLSFFSLRSFLRRFSFAGERVAHFIPILFVTNFSVIVFSKEIIPETAYIFFSISSLFLADRFSRKSDILPFALYLPLIFSTTYMMKNHGISIFLATIIFMAVKAFSDTGAERRTTIKQLSVFTIVTSLPFILWQLSGLFFGDASGGKALTIFGIISIVLGGGVFTLVERFFSNLYYLALSLPSVVVNFTGLESVFPTFIVWTLALFLFSIILVGFFNTLLYKRTVIEFYIIVYIAIVLMWPVYGKGDMMRYLIPTIPFLYLYSFSGITTFFGLFKQFKVVSKERLVVASFIVLFFLYPR